MHKEDRLYKLSKGSYTARWAHDEIVNQDNRIAELEKQLTTAEKVVLSYDMSFKARDIRDLEQQAKGVEDAFNESSKILKSEKYSKKAYLSIIDLTAELYEYGERLRNQAKALKEQGE